MHDTCNRPGSAHAGWPGNDANGWHNWEWLMDSVTHSLWCWPAQPPLKRAHCARTHIWSRARGYTARSARPAWYRIASRTGVSLEVLRWRIPALFRSRTTGRG